MHGLRTAVGNATVARIWGLIVMRQLCLHPQSQVRVSKQIAGTHHLHLLVHRAPLIAIADCCDFASSAMPLEDAVYLSISRSGIGHHGCNKTKCE